MAPNGGGFHAPYLALQVSKVAKNVLISFAKPVHLSVHM